MVGLQRFNPDDETAANLLAVAARMAMSIQLHRLNDFTTLSFLDRLERLQVFWSLCMLDMEHSLRSNTPPCIPNDEIDPLYIEPPRLPHMGCGLVQSLDGVGLSLVAARQRLLRIASRMWDALYTTKARLQPRAIRAARVVGLNDRLREWKVEWFTEAWTEICLGAGHLMWSRILSSCISSTFRYC